jgi:hypothetical protein
MLPGSTILFSIVLLALISQTALPVSRSAPQQHQPVKLYHLNGTSKSLWKPDGYTQNLWMKAFG